MPANNPFLYFDIETGGLDPSQHSILSISHARGEERTSLYAKPAGPLSDWVLKNVWEPIKQRIGGEPSSTEEEVLRSFLGTLQGHRGGTIAGWNVGYVPVPMDKGTKGFDIPFIMSRAQKYGLEKEYQQAFQGVHIRDIGREFSVRVAEEVSKYPQLVDKDLFAQARSFTKLVNINRATQRLYTVPEVAEWMGTPGKYGGFEVAGWKIKDIYKTMFGEDISGHHLSEQDVSATRRIFEEGNLSKLQGPEWVKSWNETALLNKAYASARARIAESGGIGGNFYARAAARFAENRFLQRGVAVIGEHKVGIGIGLAAATLFAVKPLGFFSGKDDQYNTIEGLSHKGMAGKDRRRRTHFGSGYQGDKYDEQVKNRFNYFADALEKYGQAEGTGHKRILIPKKALTKEQLEDVLGFVPVMIAIPEQGQKTLASYRHPTMLYHIHDHGEQWSMHEDRNAASTMLVKKWFMERTGQIKQTLSQAKQSADTSFFGPVGEFLAGIPHVLEEGIPGAYYYLKGELTGGESMLQRLKHDISPEFQKRAAQFKEIRKGSWAHIKRITKKIKKNVFSAKDDAYNTIEGLRHGGQAEQKRHEMTDFGSGWIRKALSRGIAKEEIVSAGFKLGLERQVLGMRHVLASQVRRTAEGSTVFVGKELGRGGLGVVSEAFEAGTQRTGIWKHIGEIQKYEEGVIVQSPAFQHIGLRGGDTGIFPAHKEAFLEKYTIPASRAWRQTAIELGGGVGAPQEAALQKLAHQEYGSIVPEVYGHSQTGIFMESAGRSLKPEEEGEALRWLQKEWEAQLNATPKPGMPHVTHLDPQIKNIMKKGDQYKLIDWGVATTEQLPAESRQAALREYEGYIQRKTNMLKAHRTAVELSSKYAKYGGKGHTQKTGKLPDLIPTKVLGR